MRLLFAIAAASLVLLAAQPAAAHRDRDWNWHHGGPSYYFRDLQRACGWGDRWACVQSKPVLCSRRHRHELFRRPGQGNDILLLSRGC
jgi:hypothetical protein